MVRGVVDSDCAAIEPIFHQHMIAQERSWIPLGVVHASKSIVSLSLVCEANKSKATTTLGISILHDNLPVL